jgi:hypothetical protein
MGEESCKTVKKLGIGQVEREPVAFAREPVEGIHVWVQGPTGKSFVALHPLGDEPRELTREQIGDLITALMGALSAMDGYGWSKPGPPKDGDLIACAPIRMTVEQHEVDEVAEWVAEEMPEGWEDNAEASALATGAKTLMHMVRGYAEATQYMARFEHGFLGAAHAKLEEAATVLGAAPTVFEGEGVPGVLSWDDDVPEGYVQVRLETSENTHARLLMRAELYGEVDPSVWTSHEPMRVLVRNIVEPYMGKREVVMVQEIVEVLS